MQGINYSITLKMEKRGFPETFKCSYKTAQSHLAEGSYIDSRHAEEHMSQDQNFVG